MLTVLKSAIELAVFSQSGCEYDGRGLELGERIVSVGSGLLLRCGLVYNNLFLSGSFDSGRGRGVGWGGRTLPFHGRHIALRLRGNLYRDRAAGTSFSRIGSVRRLLRSWSSSLYELDCLMSSLMEQRSGGVRFLANRAETL